MRRGVSTAEKWDEIGGPENAAKCECHDLPQGWNKDAVYRAGGYWVCVVKRKESVARRRAARSEREAERERERTARWRSANPERVRGTRLQYKFGLSNDDYEAVLAAQGGVCAVCGQGETSTNSNGEIRPLAVDHDHTTGEVRGLLCNNCNVGIGFLKDDPVRTAAAAVYLLKHQGGKAP